MLPLGSPTPYSPDGDPQVEPHPLILIIFISFSYIGLIGQMFVLLFVPELPPAMLEISGLWDALERLSLEVAEHQGPVQGPVHVITVHQDELPTIGDPPVTVYEPRDPTNQATLFNRFQVGEVEVSKPTEMGNNFSNILKQGRPSFGAAVVVDGVIAATFTFPK